MGFFYDGQACAAIQVVQSLYCAVIVPTDTVAGPLLDETMSKHTPVRGS